ncbi:MAG TPA: PEGA domain-containing protein [Polyangia bacterium]|nr:PEGA domain-containing protein [Polyangia bacterium]
MTSITAFAIALLTLSTTAPPDGTARPKPREPESLIARALQLRRAGRPTDALELLREAHDQAPSPRTLGHMGLVETSLQMWSEADAHLSAALATPGDRWVTQNRAFLADAQARAQIHVGELAVTGPPGARVRVDGRELGRLPLRAPLRLAEGDVRVTATADGYKPFSVEVTIQGGTRAAVTVWLDPLHLEAASPPAPPPPLVSDDGRAGDRRRWVGGALAAAGAGALLWGIVWLRTDGRCEVADGSSGRCLSAYSTGPAGWALTAGGASLLVAGGILLYAGFRSEGPVSVSASARSVQLQTRF